MSTRLADVRLLGTSILVMALVLVACAPSAPGNSPAGSESKGAATSGKQAPAASAPKQGGNFTFAMARDITRKGLDPNVGGGQPDIILWTQLFDTLIFQDPADNSLKPGLAESWSVSDDGLEVTLKLRKGVTFHDGTPFNAEAVKATVERIKEPSNKGISQQHLANVTAAEVVDEHTVKLKLEEPQPIVLLRLTRPHDAMVSPTAVEKMGLEEFGRKPVGTGPFILEEWIPGERFVLKRNPAYNWGPPFFQHEGPPYLETVTVRIIPEPSVRVAALETGEVDGIEFVPPEELERLRADPRFQVLESKKAGSPIVIYLNMELAPTTDLAVRRALTLATDRETINKTAYLGAQFASYGFLQPQMFGYAKDLEPRLKTDVEQAKKILDEAGWTMGPDGVRVKDGKPLELKGVFAGSPTLPFELLQAQWKEIGVNLSIQLLSENGHDEAAEKGQGNVFAVAAGGFTNEDPDLLRLVYSCETVGGRNYSRYCNKEFDAIAQEAYLLPFGEKRAQLYHQLQEILIRDAVAIPMVGENVHMAVRSNVHGLWTNSLGSYPHFVDVWKD